MHIAIEGMDGAGKTSQAKKVAQLLGGDFIAKSFHEMNDASGRYDNFMTIDSYSDGECSGIYGLRRNYFNEKEKNAIVVTDRFYISNYWSRAELLSVEYFKEISYKWGLPDLVIILYADEKTLYERIYKRNPKDKDLVKPSMSSKAYSLMRKFVKKMHIEALWVDNSQLTFDETTKVILDAYNKGIEYCVENYQCCSVIKTENKCIENETGRFIIAENELLYCLSEKKSIKIPEQAFYIGESAFLGIRKGSTIYVPKNTERISEYVFKYGNIDKIIVDKGNKVYSSDEYGLYSANGSVLIRYMGKDENVKLRNGITKIGNRAFSGNRYICTLKLPETIQCIKYGAFLGCQNLEEISFKKNNLEKIESGCFYGCNKLKKIHLDDGKYYIQNNCIMDGIRGIVYYFGAMNVETIILDDVDYIYPYAFYEKLDAESLYINASKIGSYAFENSIIKELHIGAKVLDIGERSFWNSQIAKVFLDAENESAPEIWNNTFPKETLFLTLERKQNYFLKNRDWQEKNVWSIIGKKKGDILCGSACVGYILEMEKKKEIFNKRLFWMLDIARTLDENFKGSVTVNYYNSQLMRDYVKGCIPKKFKVDDIIKDCNNKGIEIKELKYDYEALIDRKKNSKWLIMCLQSEILFEDDKLAGSNHVVIVDKIDEEFVWIISPGKRDIYKMYIHRKKFELSYLNNGQWIIWVGGKESVRN